MIDSIRQWVGWFCCHWLDLHDYEDEEVYREYYPELPEMTVIGRCRRCGQVVRYF